MCAEALENAQERGASPCDWSREDCEPSCGSWASGRAESALALTTLVFLKEDPLFSWPRTGPIGPREDREKWRNQRFRQPKLIYIKKDYKGVCMQTGQKIDVQKLESEETWVEAGRKEYDEYMLRDTGSPVLHWFQHQHRGGSLSKGVTVPTRMKCTLHDCLSCMSSK